MVGKSEGSKPTQGETGQDQVPNPGRRQLLRRAAAGAAGLAGAALLGQVGIKGAEAGGGGSNVEAHKYLTLPEKLVEKRPDLKGVDARITEIESDAVESTLEDGPKVFHFYAENGINLQTVVTPAIGSPGVDAEGKAIPSFTETEILDSNGNRVGIPGNIIVETPVLSSGDYFLVVRKDPKTPAVDNYNFRAEVKNQLEHGVHFGFVVHGKEVHYPEDQMIVLQDNNSQLTLDFNQQFYKKDSHGNYLPPDEEGFTLRAFAHAIDPQMIAAQRPVNPETDPKNQIMFGYEAVDPDNLEKIKVSGSYLEGNVGKKGFPPGSEIALQVYKNAPDTKILQQTPIKTIRFYTL